MELEELSREIASEARQLQAEMEHWRPVTGVRDPIESMKSSLSRIESRLIEVHGDTGTLIKRVPQNLAPLLLEIKARVLERIGSLGNESVRSCGSSGSKEPVPADGDQIEHILHKLTLQEQRLFHICFQSGLVTYREVAEKLGISPVSAKNIVNRLFQNGQKSRLFEKEYAPEQPLAWIGENVVEVRAVKLFG